MSTKFRDLLALEPLTADELGFLLDQSKPFQEIQKHPLKKLATLRGKTVALAFFETSTRTRISFGAAASRLGADTMNLQAEASSLKKGETLLDTVFNLDAMKPDCLVMRHAASGATDYVARRKRVRFHGKLFETIVEPPPQSAQESTTSAYRFDDCGPDDCGPD